MVMTLTNRKYRVGTGRPRGEFSYGNLEEEGVSVLNAAKRANIKGLKSQGHHW